MHFACSGLTSGRSVLLLHLCFYLHLVLFVRILGILSVAFLGVYIEVFAPIAKWVGCAGSAVRVPEDFCGFYSHSRVSVRYVLTTQFVVHLSLAIFNQTITEFPVFC